MTTEQQLPGYQSEGRSANDMDYIELAMYTQEVMSYTTKTVRDLLQEMERFGMVVTVEREPNPESPEKPFVKLRVEVCEELKALLEKKRLEAVALMEMAGAKPEGPPQ